MSRVRWARATAVLVPIFMLGALLLWGASSPPGSSPDDDYHMASIWCARGVIEGQCELGSSEGERLLPRNVVDAAGCFALDSAQAASCELHDGMRSTDRGNWFHAGYPPFFYSTMSWFVGPDLTMSVLLMRAVNATLYVGIVLGVFLLLPRALRPALIAGAAMSLVPLGMFLIPSLNPSAWSVISATGLWVATWGFFESSGRRRLLLGTAMALLVLMGAGARSDSAVYSVIAMLAGAVLAFKPDRRFFVGLLLPAALTVVAVALFFSGSQSGVISPTSAADGPYGTMTLAFINLKLLPQLWAGALGYWGLGWLDTMLPGVVWVSTIAVFAALAFWGVRVGAWRKWLAMGGVALSLVVVPMYILLHDHVVVGSYVQPRYIYPLIIIFGGLALAGVASSNLGLRRAQLWPIATALIVANSVALHVNIRRYVTGQDVGGFNLDVGIEWWWGGPISPMAIWLLGTVAFALVVVPIVWTVGRQDGTSDGQSADLSYSSRV